MAPADELLRPIQLEVRYLRLVVAVVQEQSLTRAAERLNFTQSALSHQLREIEDRLGVALFYRLRKRLILTPAGEKVVTASRRLLAELLQLEEEITGVGSESERSIA
jgi:LysR family transcriptional regulator for metE and metH